MVVKETFRNMRAMEPVKSHYDIKANRKLLNEINTNISTLKCYNVDLTGPDGETENSTFLVDMEEKIPHNTYIKWEEEKEKIKQSAKIITIEAFLDFYSKQINMEENAQYMRKPFRTEGRSQRNSEKALMLQTRVSNGKKPYKETQPGRQKARGFRKRDSARGNNFQNKEKERGQKSTPNPQAGGVSPPRFCIFCETNTHSTGFCRIGKYTAKYKNDQCQKHNACYMCFQSSEHRAATCPKMMKCLLCTKTHHFNNHPRSEINEYYKKQKKTSKKQ